MPTPVLDLVADKVVASLRCCALFGALLPAVAQADAVSPASFSASMAPGESISLIRTVTVSPSLTTGLVDIFFLADSTGSMGPSIDSVRLGATGIMAATAAFGDVRWGVGEYRDVGEAFVYRTNQDLTADRSGVQGGIDQWQALAGHDVPEASLFALQQVAETISWRDGSTRILAWFGDAPGHDPRNGVTEASATAALVARGIAVEAIDVGTTGAFQSLDFIGQASRIASATGGHLFAGVDADQVAAAIEEAIGLAVSNYTRVCLDSGDTPAGLVASVSGCITGNFDRGVERSFDFSVTYTGAASGIYAIDSHAIVDGGRVAGASDRISVTDIQAGNGVPLPGTPALLAAGLLALTASRRRPAG